MAYLDALAHDIVGLVRTNRDWMIWNLLLAAVPAVLAVALFARPHRRKVGWCIGVGVFLLFLPNAPYVVTDLIHLRGDAARASSDGAVVAGVLPLYGGFILAGFLAYVLCTELVTHEIRRHRPGVARWSIEIGLHALCAIGIVLGRLARLNSWDTIAAPAGTVEQVFTTLTWRGAPVAVMVVFLAVWATHLVVRTLAAAVLRSGTQLFGRFSAAT